MNRNKICPDCETEYMPHIEKCADCGAALLSPEELIIAHAAKKQLAEKAIKNAVVVREGDQKWLNELYDVLIDAGIPCTIISEAGCKKSCCGDTCRLIVAIEDGERAQERIEKHFMEMHPEIQASNELVSQGKCPACGSPVSADDKECSDCGLTLVIVEESGPE